MLEELVRRWIDLVFWWWPKGHGEPPKRPEGAAPVIGYARPRRAAEQASAPRVAPHGEIARDDVTAIKGIGPVLQDRLRSLGITRFEDLAAADPDDLAAKLKDLRPISTAQVRGWVDAAQKASRSKS
jgi:predicted flap endonuclease-1-like 5' DNA nuclease